MPRFGRRSKLALETAHPELQRLFNEVIKHIDCSILEGHRGEVAQNKAFEAGASTLHWPLSKHNYLPSQAVDVAPYPIDWTDKDRFYHFAGFVKGIAASIGVDIRWGGDWDSDNDFSDQSFNDLPHYELNGATLEEDIF